jgi:hypothetical protein
MCLLVNTARTRDPYRGNTTPCWSPQVAPFRRDAGTETGRSKPEDGLRTGRTPTRWDNGDTAMPVRLQVVSQRGYASRHAKVDVWNRKNDHDWTPLRIAEGVHRGMNLRRSPETAEVLRKLMTDAGVSTEVEPEKVISGATK